MIRPEPPPAGTITCIASAATYDPFDLSPGEIATIFGNQIGPVQPASAQLDAAGNVATMLAGMQVLVNGVPAPVLYASPGQINFVTPFATPPLKPCPSNSAATELWSSPSTSSRAPATSEPSPSIPLVPDPWPCSTRINP